MRRGNYVIVSDAKWIPFVDLSLAEVKMDRERNFLTKLMDANCAINIIPPSTNCNLSVLITAKRSLGRINSNSWFCFLIGAKYMLKEGAPRRSNSIDSHEFNLLIFKLNFHVQKVISTLFMSSREQLSLIISFYLSLHTALVPIVFESKLNE